MSISNCWTGWALAQADVIGCSIGGWIAAELATKSPASFDRLVLVGPVGVKTGPPDGSTFQTSSPCLRANWNACCSTIRSACGWTRRLTDEQLADRARATARRSRCLSGSPTCTIPTSPSAAPRHRADAVPARRKRRAGVGRLPCRLRATAAERAHRHHRPRPGTRPTSSNRTPSPRTVLQFLQAGAV